MLTSVLKVNDRNGGSGVTSAVTATERSVPRGAVVAQRPTEKPAQDKSTKQAGVSAKQETSGQRQSAAAGSSTAPNVSAKAPAIRTIRAPDLSSVPGASAFGKHGLPKPALLTVRKVVTTAPAPRQYSAPAAATASASAPAPVAGQKRKPDNEEHPSPKKAKTQGDETSRGTSGITRHRATSTKKPKREKPTTAKPRGFSNYEKNCYANAVIQCLGTCEAFVTHFKTMADGAARADETKYPPDFITGAGERRGGWKRRELLRRLMVNLDDSKM